MPATDSQDGQVQGATPRSPVSAQPNGVANASAGEGTSTNTNTSTSINTNNAELFKPGDIVGGSYEIIDQLGRGAMGMVYKARHISMTTEYAVKVLTTAQLNDLAVMRFQNEAQAIAKLNHPNIIAIYNFGLHDGRLPFYVMDLLVGDNLLDKLDAHGPMPVELALPVFIEVCAGLSYAHRKGIMHRDVKPANFVILDAPDVRGVHVKVVDFGLVKFAEELKPDAQRLTAIGEVCGSPSYMSPEQSSGQKTDPRSDIYSLGCSLFQSLTGKLPLLGRNATETMMLKHEKAAPTLTSKGEGRVYSENLELLVAKMLAKAPMDRYQTMDAVAQDLRNIMDNKALGTPQAAASSLDRGTDNVDSSTSAIGSAYLSKSGPAGTASGSNMSQRAQSVKKDEIAGAGALERAAAERTIIQRADSVGKSKSDPGKEKLEDGSGAAAIATTAKWMAISVLAVGLVGILVFFAWQALQRPKAAAIRPKEQLFDLAGTRPVELTKAKYFSRTVEVNGSEFIEFDFPDVDRADGLGVIARSERDMHQMQGKVRFPKGVPLYLSPASGAIKVAHFFEKFRPGEIVGIVLSPLYVPTDDLFIFAATVPGISQVVIGDCPDLTARIIPSLSNLKLTVFAAANSNIDGRLFAIAHFWQNLEILDLSACKSVTPVLKQLAGSSKLEVLGLRGTRLSRIDYQLISGMRNLKYLNIAGDEITAEDMQALSRLPELSVMDATRSRLMDGSLAAGLKHFSALKRLNISKRLTGAKELQLVARACPNLKVEEGLVDQGQVMQQFMQQGIDDKKHLMQRLIDERGNDRGAGRRHGRRGPGGTGAIMEDLMDQSHGGRNPLMEGF
jgi:serine/threonine protein kinase